MIAKKYKMKINRLCKIPLQIPLQFLPWFCNTCKGKNLTHRLNLKITHLVKMEFVWN